MEVVTKQVATKHGKLIISNLPLAVSSAHYSPSFYQLLAALLVKDSNVKRN